MATLAPSPKMQFFDGNGNPLAGGKLYTYQAGPTVTPLATYTDSTGITENANPVILDSRGEASVWLGTSLYYMELKTSADVLVWTADNIGGVATLSALAAPGGSALIGFLQSGAGATARTAQAKMREFVSVKDFGAVGDGVTDDTAAIQAALNASSKVYIPEGTYVTSSVIGIQDNQMLVGAGSSVTLLKNDVSDVIRMTPNATTNGNYFQVHGIGCIRTFNVASTTIAFNFENTSFINCTDLSAKYFYKGMYLARNPGSKECWYNRYSELTFRECLYGLHIDDSISSQSVNGCTFEQISITNWDYTWLTANPALVSAGIRYSGYGHVFSDSYIQGCSRHIWRDQVGGKNTLIGLYLESAVVPGEVVYAPLRWQGNQDYFLGGHGDGFVLESNFYDPQGVFIVNYASNSPIVSGGSFEAGGELILNGDFESGVTNWTADTSAIAAIAGGVTGNCLQLSQTSGATGYAYQIIFTDPGKRYKITFSHKNGTFTGRVLVGRSITGAQYAYNPTLNDANWTAYSYYFTPTTETTYVTFACAGASQNTLFDAVTVKQVAVGTSDDISTAGTMNAGAIVTTLPVYANNAAALAGGLLVDQFYRTGADPDAVCVVH